MVKVPNVFEKPEAAAKAELEKAGFTVSVEHDKGEPVFGKVYKQDQAAGSEAEKGSTITIRVF
nr:MULTISPECIES: PASTA domain-containing protein [Helcobacillus]